MKEMKFYLNRKTMNSETQKRGNMNLQKLFDTHFGCSFSLDVLSEIKSTNFRKFVQKLDFISILNILIENMIQNSVCFSFR
jgi:hypothetical protein